MISLKDTAALMDSEDYKVRLKAEYWQVRLRYNQLIRFVYNPHKNKDLTEEQKELMSKQALYMYHYMLCLADRCKMEGVDVHEE